jgi:hypothetical protein
MLLGVAVNFFSKKKVLSLSATAAAGLLQEAVAEAFTGSKFPVSDNTGPSAMNTYSTSHGPPRSPER